MSTVLVAAVQMRSIDNEEANFARVRDLAARAQVLRGDLKRKRRQLEPAVQDYLRTVILFENIRDVQPEALYKAGETLEELRDARAKDLFARLQREYPDSKYAARAREK